MVRKEYVSTASASSAEACSRGLNALQYLRWLFTALQVDTVASSSNVVRLPSISPDIQAVYLDALNSVLCDGKTLLITLPTVWRVTSGMSAGAGSICQILAAVCVGCIVYAFLYRNHPVIRSSSPHFLSMSLLGVAVMLEGTSVLVQPPSFATCSGMAWLWSFGFSLTFAPLFAKTWRIYRIFGRRKLSVVKISNRKLAMVVLAILTLDLVLMSIWQALSPLQPYTTTDYTGSNPVVQNDYSQCGVAGDGRTMLALVAVSKGVLLLFGALMAFTTRKVTSTFNESSGIALAIYNVLFSIGIIAPIILVIGAIGDVLVLLLLFLGLWVSCFTAAILFVPKLLRIHGASAQQVTEMSKGSSSQYSFLSLAQLSTVPIVMAYIVALETHLDTVRRRLAEIKASKQGGTAAAAAGSKVASTTEHSPTSDPHQQHARRVTLSTTLSATHQHDAVSNTTSSHKRFLSTTHADNPSPSPTSTKAEADVHSVPLPQCLLSPPPKQRTHVVAQASPSPVLREKRVVGQSSRVESGVGAGVGEAGGVSGSEVSASQVVGALLEGMRNSSVSSVDEEESRGGEEAAATAANAAAVEAAAEEGK